MDFLVQIGLYEIDRVDLVEFCSFPQGPHTMMLWRLFFLGEWIVFGLDPTKWHLTIAIVHGLAATALFFCARAWSISRTGAFAMALIWAGAAFGGWDNPTLWLMCGMAPMAWFFFLLALREVAVIGRAAATPREARWAAFRMAGMFFLSILTWSDMLLSAPVLLVALLARGIYRQPKSVIISWVLSWMAPILILGPLNLMFVLPFLGTGGRLQDRTPWSVASRSASQVSVALGTLTYAYVAYPDILDTDLYDAPREFRQDDWLWPKILLAAAVLAVAVGSIRNKERPLVIVIAVAVLLCQVAVNLGGIALSFRDAINHGHYLYLPCLFWAVVLGAIVSRFAPIFRRRWLTAVITICAVGFFAWHQTSVAAATAEIQRYMFASPTERFHRTEAILRALSHQAQQTNSTIELPDTPLPLISYFCPYWPLASFVALTFPDSLPGIEIIPAEDVTSDQLRDAAMHLQSLEDPHAGLWESRMRQIYPLLTAVDWLVKTVDDQPEEIACPNVLLDLWGSTISLKQLLQFGMAHGRGLSEKLVDGSPQPARESYPALWQLLRSSNQEEASILLSLFGWEP